MSYIERLVHENEELKNRVYNLNLYLSYVEQVDKTLFNVLEDEFSGLPGYANDAEWERVQ